MKLLFNKNLFVIVFLFSHMLAQAKNTLDIRVCDELKMFSQGIEVGESRKITFITEDGKGIFPQKFCKHSTADERGIRFCEWLSVNSSSEYMESNITRIISCITNSKNIFSKKIRINELIGKFTISDPFIEVLNIDVDFEYYFNSVSKNGRNYFSITVRGVNNSDDD
ncbi:MAG: hypothetical protein HY254_21560 [Burkholderiales bacterium]|nr:hypothetical protein [Burkholderiales bacterium]